MAAAGTGELPGLAVLIGVGALLLTMYKRWKKKRMSLFIAALILVLTGVGGMMIRKMKSTEPPGMLEEVRYNKVRGMIMGEDFYIELSPNEVICAAYWIGDEPSEFQMITVEHLAIKQEQWSEVDAMLMELAPILKPRKNDLQALVKRLVKSGGSMQDGGNQDDLTLVWETENGKKTVKYYWPDDDRVIILTDLLEKTVKGGGGE